MNRRYSASVSKNLSERLAETLQDAVDLMREAAISAAMPSAVLHGNLLAQCMDLCAEHQARRPEPIRTLHHFACTGGTLISKCLAALPNVQLLSEVDPLAVLPTMPAKPSFTPTDMVALLAQSTQGTNQELLIELFQCQIQLVHQDAVLKGQRLIIRDHAHSHFCVGPAIPLRPNLRAMLPTALKVLSVLTVRHPIDSFASLAAQDWVQFKPGTLDEYCHRYLNFLDGYPGVPVLRYEDFVLDPETAMKQLCKILDLHYESQFKDLFSVFWISGDSGRSGAVIASRSNRPAVEKLQVEAQASGNFVQLVERLGYNLEP